VANYDLLTTEHLHPGPLGKVLLDNENITACFTPSYIIYRLKKAEHDYLQNAYSYQVAFNPSHFLVEFGD
jgi:hypothetical protein